MNPLAPVFATTFLYSACKVMGVDHYDEWLREQLKDLDSSEWPGLRTLGELRRVCNYDLYTDGSTYITRARCVAAGHFLRSPHDVWLTVDDDLFTTEDVLRRLIVAARASRGGVAVPYMNRDGKSMTFRKVSGPTLPLDLADPSHIRLRTVDRVGLGCVALHRDLVETLAKDAPKFRERDGPPNAPGEPDCPGLFLEGPDEGTWVGEDYFFSALCKRAGRSMYVLLEAPASHAGLWAMLDAEGVIRVRDPERGKTLDEALRRKEAAAAETGQPPPSQGE